MRHQRAKKARWFLQDITETFVMYLTKQGQFSNFILEIKRSHELDCEKLTKKRKQQKCASNEPSLFIPLLKVTGFTSIYNKELISLNN